MIRPVARSVHRGGIPKPFRIGAPRQGV